MQRLMDAAAFPKSLLHPAIRDKVWNAIVRSTNATSQDDLAGAVRDAFVTVEDAVRVAGGHNAKDFGELLVRKAFDPDTGPMGDRDATKPLKERLGLQTLFIGALNAYRNPVSHRKVVLELHAKTSGVHPGRMRRAPRASCVIKRLSTPAVLLSVELLAK